MTKGFFFKLMKMHFPVINTLETDMGKLGNIYYTATHQVDRALNLFESDT